MIEVEKVAVMWIAAKLLEFASFDVCKLTQVTISTGAFIPVYAAHVVWSACGSHVCMRC